MKGQHMAVAAKKKAGKYPWSGTKYGDILTRISNLKPGKSTTAAAPDDTDSGTFMNRLNSALARFEIDSVIPKGTKIQKRTLDDGRVRITLVKA